MEKFIITTGKTIDLAVAAALKELNMDRTSVSVEVLEQPKSGFLGFGSQPAKVKVSYGDEDEPVPAAALSSDSRSKPKASILQPQRPAASDAPEKEPPAGHAPVQAEPPRQPQAPMGAHKPQAAKRPPEEKKPQPKKEEKQYTPAAPGSVEERIEVFLKGLLERMGSSAVPHAEMVEDNLYKVDLVGPNLGILIGRRGETLDAIQHLSNYAINREGHKRVRINVDAENYRRKREEALERLAQKVAGKVIRYHRDITLEPMNAYERHVIHATLQEYPGVSTFSVGSEPNRRVVVALGEKR